MRVSVESTGSLERRLRIEVPAERIEQQVEQRLRSLGKNAKVKGFRPGKVPYRVLQQRYGGQVRQEVLSEVVQSTYGEALSQESLNPAGQPHIETEQAEPGRDLQYTATIEVFPDIELEKLEGLEISQPSVSITDEDIDAVLGRIQRQHATWEEVTRPSASGDRVIADYEGSVDGEAFQGGSGEQATIELGAGQVLEDFEAGLTGVEPGAEVDFEVTFPDDYQVPEVAGKKAQFRARVHSVREPHFPELDDAFAEHLGVEGGLDGLRETLRRSMEQERDKAVRDRVKRQVLDALYEHNPVELPGALVDEEIERMKQETAQRMNIPAEQLPELPRELFEEQARRRVALGLIIGELIQQQDIQLDRQRLEQMVYSMVAGQENAEETARSYLQDSQVLRRLEPMVMEEQVVDWLLERAEVRDEPMSFEQLMASQSQ